MSELIEILSNISAINKDALEEYYPRVRDRDDIKVLKDKTTDVIVLSESSHMSNKYYEERAEKDSFTVRDTEIASPRLEDNVRRKEQFGSYIRNKRWLDFGCGLGGMLDEMSNEPIWAAGLEPNIERSEIVKAKGHIVVNSIDEIEAESLDIVTMFHVMEHLTNPISVTKEIRKKLKKGGILLVEVPHARDALFTLYECDEFKRFTFWSEHLVLHTRQSLMRLLNVAGLRFIETMGYQRYPISNHLFWLAKHKPGGHEQWRFLTNPKLDYEYSSLLSSIDRTDTIIAICRNEYDN
jgi:SAM-dependent methyltransferase